MYQSLFNLTIINLCLISAFNLFDGLLQCRTITKCGKNKNKRFFEKHLRAIFWREQQFQFQFCVKKNNNFNLVSSKPSQAILLSKILYFTLIN